MESTWCSSEAEKQLIVTELKKIGVCDLCSLRYIGVKEPFIYRDSNAVKQILYDVGGETAVPKVEEEQEESEAKKYKVTPCVACLGLLQGGIQQDILNGIVEKIIASEVESVSYNPVLTLPISMRFRAYAVWHHLAKTFPELYTKFSEYKPEGIPLKSAWKWVASNYLQEKIDPKSDWCNEGKLSVQIFPAYVDEEKECQVLKKIITDDGRIQFKKGRVPVTRQSVESLLSNLASATFSASFTCPPPVPSEAVKVEKVTCLHDALFVAGRYCKYSRTLSQTPWVIDGARKTVDSVEELISGPIMKALNAESSRFSSSGREDVDVRTLGNGRPFVFEVINPKKTALTPASMKAIQDTINASTNLVQVRDLQIVNKKDVSVLKEGEESKTKSYCALCISPEREVTPSDLERLNSVTLPLVLTQWTPVRVMHRRSVLARERSILKLHAELPASSKSHQNHLFLLHLNTQAGTYIKEFVHGDLGRTSPSVSDILGYPVDILALDVEGVDLNWPPEVPA